MADSIKPWTRVAIDDWLKMVERYPYLFPHVPQIRVHKGASNVSK